METKRLGNSDLLITAIGFGAWAIGGSGWEFAWGGQDDSDSVAAIHEALDAGINWIDTAAVYGLGHSEEVVARALDGVRQRPYVFTKCSMVWDEHRQIGHSLKADSIRRECEASLRRLRVEAIGLYQIHWPDPDAAIEEAWATLAVVQQEGKVRYLGVSNFDVALSPEEVAEIEASSRTLRPDLQVTNTRRAGATHCTTPGRATAVGPEAQRAGAGGRGDRRERALHAAEGDDRAGQGRRPGDDPDGVHR
jgi:aryl-alcohol dehydrogenase-like predicted oxidoreductase